MKVAQAKIEMLKPDEVNMEEYEASVFLKYWAHTLQRKVSCALNLSEKEKKPLPQSENFAMGFSAECVALALRSTFKYLHVAGSNWTSTGSHCMTKILGSQTEELEEDVSEMSPFFFFLKQWAGS